MLARELRLCKTADFQRVRARGRCWSNRMLVLCISPNEQAHNRFGFSVSKRIGNAVRRNRVKRLLREAVRGYVDLLAPGWDVMLIARSDVREADFPAVEDAVVNLLGLAGLFRVAGDASSE